MCKGLVNIGNEVGVLPAETIQGIDYWEQCKGLVGINMCKGIAALGEWAGLINTDYLK